MARVHKVQIFGQSTQSRNCFLTSSPSPSSSCSSFPSSASAGLCDDFSSVLNANEDIDDDLPRTLRYHTPNCHNYHHHRHHYQHNLLHQPNPNHSHLLTDSHYQPYSTQRPHHGYCFRLDSNRFQMAYCPHTLSQPCDQPSSSSSSNINPTLNKRNASSHLDLSGSFSLIGGSATVEPVGSTGRANMIGRGYSGFRSSLEHVNRQSSSSNLQYISTITGTTTTTNTTTANESINKPPCILRSSITSSDMRSTINLYNRIVSDINRLERYINGKDPFLLNSPPRQSRCLVDFVNSRASGNSMLERASLSKEFIVHNLLANNVLKERTYSVGEFDKIFCSQWLNSRSVIFGTKCNQLMVLDLQTKKLVQIPNLSSSNLSSGPPSRCGIHCITINPSRTLLAAGGENPNDIAIYKLPTLDPIGVGEGAHTDWIFDACWVDDQFLVTGSRDSTLALWRIDDDSENPVTQVSGHLDHVPGQYTFLDPLSIFRFDKSDKIRALLFDNKRSEVVALSLNANLHRFDVCGWRPSGLLKLHYQNDNVCLAQEDDHNLYAVGSKTHVILVDQRHFEITSKIHTSQQGIRSLSFYSGVMTIGTGSGALLFYDIRNKKYINVKDTKDQASLKVSKGWLDPENQEQHQDIDYNPAIYTHQYDSTGTRIFTAGGPLSAGMVGNFASIWY